MPTWAPPSSLPPPGQRFDMGSDKGAVKRDESLACTIRPDFMCLARRSARLASPLGRGAQPTLVCGQELGEGRILAALLHRR